MNTKRVMQCQNPPRAKSNCCKQDPCSGKFFQYIPVLILRGSVVHCHKTVLPNASSIATQKRISHIRHKELTENCNRFDITAKDLPIISTFPMNTHVKDTELYSEFNVFGAKYLKIVMSCNI